MIVAWLVLVELVYCVFYHVLRDVRVLRVECAAVAERALNLLGAERDIERLVFAFPDRANNDAVMPAGQGLRPKLALHHVVIIRPYFPARVRVDHDQRILKRQVRGYDVATFSVTKTCIATGSFPRCREEHAALADLEL